METKKTALVREPETLWTWMSEEGMPFGRDSQPGMARSLRRSWRSWSRKAGVWYCLWGEKEVRVEVHRAGEEEGERAHFAWRTTLAQGTPAM